MAALHVILEEGRIDEGLVALQTLKEAKETGKFNVIFCVFLNKCISSITEEKESSKYFA